MSLLIFFNTMCHNFNFNNAMFSALNGVGPVNYGGNTLNN